MKKLFLIGIIALCASCTQEEKTKVRAQKPSKEPKPVEQTTNPQPKNEPLTPKAATTKPLPPRTIPTSPTISELTDEPVPNKPAIEPYSNPNINKWEEAFGKDAKWQDLYQSSVTHYLNGISNNLAQNASLKITKSQLVFVYGKKMYDAFPLTPEFAEYSALKFEQSEDLKGFIAQHPGRITED